MANNEKKSPQSVDSFIRVQGITAAIINIVVNPLLAWLVNRKMEFVPLFGNSCIVADTIITSLVLSVLVALFSAAGIRGYLKAEGSEAAGVIPCAGRLLSLLPEKAWAAGLVIGVCAILVLLPVTIGVFHLSGITGFPFIGFALYKAVYTGLLAYIATYCVMFRQLKLAGQT